MKSMKFSILETRFGSNNYYTAELNDENHGVPGVPVVEIRENINDFSSNNCMAALQTLVASGSNERDSFARAIEHIVGKAFMAGADHALTKEEIITLIRDLEAVFLAVKKGSYQPALDELEQMIGCLHKKDISGEKYLRKLSPSLKRY